MEVEWGGRVGVWEGRTGVERVDVRVGPEGREDSWSQGLVRRVGGRSGAGVGVEVEGSREREGVRVMSGVVESVGTGWRMSREGEAARMVVEGRRLGVSSDAPSAPTSSR